MHVYVSVEARLCYAVGCLLRVCVSLGGDVMLCGRVAVVRMCLLRRGYDMQSGGCCIYVCLLSQGYAMRYDGCCLYVCLLG